MPSDSGGLESNSPQDWPHKVSHMANTSLKGLRVLVVEDEYFLAKDLEKALIAAGADVVGPIPDLVNALQQTVESAFDVAIIDINLRGSHAYAIGEILQRRGIPFVFATGYTASSIPKRFCQITRWEKPYDMGAMLADVARLCSGSE